MNYNKWLNKIERLDYKLVAITGSTGSLGKMICEHLAYLGADLLFIDRNEKKSLEHKKELLVKYPNISISNVIMDLAKIDSVKNAICKLKNYDIDYLILNAGAYSIKRQKTELHFENIFQINYISPYLLCSALISKLNERNGKIIVVGSISYNFVNLKENDLDYSNCSKQIKVYGNSKRWLMFSINKLVKDYPNVRFGIAHPGITFTNIYNDYPKWLYYIVKYPMKLIFMSPKKASLGVIKALNEEVEEENWFGPRYFGIWGKPKKSKYKYNELEASKIADYSSNIINKIK